MNINQVNHFNNSSIQTLLEEQLLSPSHLNYTIILGKSKSQQCTPQSLKSTENLLHRDGDKWLDVIQRFLECEFQLTFTFCINNPKTYKTLISQTCRQGSINHQNILQQNIEQLLDYNTEIRQQQIIKFHWSTYLKYLEEWVYRIPQQTQFSLQKIENRLNKFDNIYQYLNSKQKIQFIAVLCKVFEFHEKNFTRRLQLRKFWNSVQGIRVFLTNNLVKQGQLIRLVSKVSIFSRAVFQVRSNKQKEDEQERQMIIKMLLAASRVSFLQQIFLLKAQILAKQLSSIQMIDYKKLSTNIQQVLDHQSSLIYNYPSDDIASLIQQLITSLTKYIPNFLSYFVNRCFQVIQDVQKDQTITCDIVLKICILSKEIIEHKKLNAQCFDIKDMVDGLMAFKQKSQLIQIKTLKLIHYFKQILPCQYFHSYHENIFTILRTVLQSSIMQNRIWKRQIRQNQVQIQNYNSDLQRCGIKSNQSDCHNCNTQCNNAYSNNNHNNNHNNNKNFQSKICHCRNPTYPQSNMSSFSYSDISYMECIRILQEQADNQYSQNTEIRIRKNKYSKHKQVYFLFQSNLDWIISKITDLLDIDGYSDKQPLILKVLYSILSKYPGSASRRQVILVRVLSKQFMDQFQRLHQIVSHRQRVYQKANLILQCIQATLKQIDPQNYFFCQQLIEPIASLIRLPQSRQFQQKMLEIIYLLLNKANTITTQISKLLVFSKQIWLNNSRKCLTNFSQIIKQLCKRHIIQPIRNQWEGLIEFYSICIQEYLQQVQQTKIISYSKSWDESVYLIQLFIQTYYQSYQQKQNLQIILFQIQQELQHHQRSEQIYQILMTIHHIIQRSDIYSYSTFADLSIYKQKYSLNLLQITISDIMTRSFRAKIFDLQNSNNSIHQFIKDVITIKEQIKQTYQQLSTQNSSLPLNLVNIDFYVSSAINQLKRQKIINSFDQNQLNIKLLNQRFLSSSNLFE